MTSEKMIRKDKNQNIQVFVRLRPMNQRERDIRSIGVVEVVNNREVVVRQSQQTQHTKKFTFDKAFGPNAKQVEVYQDVVSPLIEEVLAGYNCTVFAYGQTGTGKTHTMVGEHTSDGTTWQNDPLSGIIPRALSQLFDELRLTNTEYTVRVSYLELYNEELFDLLSTSEDNSKLRIYEDVTRKGSNIVNGLEEITVYNKNEVYKIMSQGQERKRVACTLMNAQSSRSHTVFTIVVHMKENSPEGEELVKIGKLNLVDLAGSENISKAGSDNPAKKERARECVNINQSLLTLGRVITALVERHPHIPYRESKLTRILQESLGGRTKTSIIATISPGHKDLEETMSTLEYAHRAKNIQNKPEINQKMTKKAILKEYAEEIDRLKRDLQATRDKNGVYLASETYSELTLKQDEQRKEIQELLLQKRAIEDARDKMEAVFNEVSQSLQQKETQLDITKRRLDATQERLANTKNVLYKTRGELEEQRHLVSVVSETERKLSSQASSLLETTDVATTHVQQLHDTVDRRRKLESTNLEVTKTYQSRSAEDRGQLQDTVHTFAAHTVGALVQIVQGLETHCSANISCQKEVSENIEQLSQSLTKLVQDLKSLSQTKQSEISELTATKKSELRKTLEQQQKSVEDTLYKVIQGVSEGVGQVVALGRSEKENAECNIKLWLSTLLSHITSLSRQCTSLASNMSEGVAARRRRAHGRTSSVQNRLAENCLIMEAHTKEIISHKSSLEERLLKLESDIENKRNETTTRIEHWIERERQIFEQRIQTYRQEELEYLEKNLSEKQAEIIELRSQITSILDTCVVEQRRMCVRSKEEIKGADVGLRERLEEEEECETALKEYLHECQTGCTAASTDVEDLSNKLIGLIHNLSDQITGVLERTQGDVQCDVNSAISSNKEICSKSCEENETLVDEIVRDNASIVNTVMEQVQQTTSFTQTSLETLLTSSNFLTSSTENHQLSVGKSLQSIQSEVEQVKEHVDRGVEQMRRTEEQYLDKEIQVYQPSGSTPDRREYRYPRVLPATSPHERIIKRFRDNYIQNGDYDCITLDSDIDTSDSVSATSDDSVFVTPSPPTPSHKPLSKSTSDTNIYQQEPPKDMNSRGKENSESCIILPKKPSKLPAPTSIKKPLLERNTPC